jgi:hypothetical protein
VNRLVKLIAAAALALGLTVGFAPSPAGAHDATFELALRCEFTRPAYMARIHSHFSSTIVGTYPTAYCVYWRPNAAAPDLYCSHLVIREGPWENLVVGWSPYCWAA